MINSLRTGFNIFTVVRYYPQLLFFIYFRSSWFMMSSKNGCSELSRYLIYSVLFLSNTFLLFVRFVHFSDGNRNMFLLIWLSIWSSTAVTAVLIIWLVCWCILMSNFLCHYIWSWCTIWRLECSVGVDVTMVCDNN